MADHLGTESQTVVRLAEAGIPGASEKLIDRPAVAIARVEIAQRVERQTEGIDLAVRHIFGVRTVGPHPVGVTRVHRDRPLVLALHGRVVGEAVAGIDPAVEAPGEGVGHPVRVAVAEDAVEHVARVCLAVAVVVPKQEDIGNAVHERGVG